MIPKPGLEGTNVRRILPAILKPAPMTVFISGTSLLGRRMPMQTVFNGQVIGVRCQKLPELESYFSIIVCIVCPITSKSICTIDADQSQSAYAALTSYEILKVGDTKLVTEEAA